MDSVIDYGSNSGKCTILASGKVIEKRALEADEHKKPLKNVIASIVYLSDQVRQNPQFFIDQHEVLEPGKWASENRAAFLWSKSLSHATAAATCLKARLIEKRKALGWYQIINRIAYTILIKKLTLAEANFNCHEPIDYTPSRMYMYAPQYEELLEANGFEDSPLRKELAEFMGKQPTLTLARGLSIQPGDETYLFNDMILKFLERKHPATIIVAKEKHNLTDPKTLIDGARFDLVCATLESAHRLTTDAEVEALLVERGFKEYLSPQQFNAFKEYLFDKNFCLETPGNKVTTETDKKLFARFAEKFLNTHIRFTSDLDGKEFAGKTATLSRVNDLKRARQLLFNEGYMDSPSTRAFAEYLTKRTTSFSIRYYAHLTTADEIGAFRGQVLAYLKTIRPPEDFGLIERLEQSGHLISPTEFQDAYTFCTSGTVGGFIRELWEGRFPTFLATQHLKSLTNFEKECLKIRLIESQIPIAADGTLAGPSVKLFYDLFVHFLSECYPDEAQRLESMFSGERPPTPAHVLEEFKRPSSSLTPAPPVRTTSKPKTAATPPPSVQPSRTSSSATISLADWISQSPASGSPPLLGTPFKEETL